MIDDIDRQLLKLLRHDSRRSITDLAGTLGLTRTTVKARIERLRTAGVIEKFTIQTREGADQDLIHAVSLLDIQLSKADRIQRELTRIPELTSIHSTNGKWSIVAHSQSNTLADFDHMLNRLGALDGVKHVETCLLLSRIS